MKDINRNWTKGKFSSDKQKGKPGYCFMAQVWNDDGNNTVAMIEPTNTAIEASANAVLFSDALNTANKTGLTPSELLKQRDEMKDALKAALLILETENIFGHARLAIKEAIANAKNIYQ